MKTIILWKYNKVTGFWVFVRDCDLNNANLWLAVFEKDEPNEFFKLANRRPSKKPF